jgi:hypothetical protein
MLHASILIVLYCHIYICYSQSFSDYLLYFYVPLFCYPAIALRKSIFATSICFFVSAQHSDPWKFIGRLWLALYRTSVGFGFGVSLVVWILQTISCWSLISSPSKTMELKFSTTNYTLVSGTDRLENNCKSSTAMATNGTDLDDLKKNVDHVFLMINAIIVCCKFDWCIFHIFIMFKDTIHDIWKYGFTSYFL